MYLSELFCSIQAWAKASLRMQVKHFYRSIQVWAKVSQQRMQVKQLFCFFSAGSSPHPGLIRPFLPGLCRHPILSSRRRRPILQVARFSICCCSNPISTGFLVPPFSDVRLPVLCIFCRTVALLSSRFWQRHYLHAESQPTAPPQA